MTTQRKIWGKSTWNNSEPKIYLSSTNSQNTLMSKKMETSSQQSTYWVTFSQKSTKLLNRACPKKFKESSTNNANLWVWTKTQCDKFTTTQTKFVRYSKPYVDKKLTFPHLLNLQQTKFSCFLTSSSKLSYKTFADTDKKISLKIGNRNSFT